MTPFKNHVKEWKDCSRCFLCKTRKNIVLARGTLPASVLFVGEAPGESEDVLGRPFVGPAGKLLDEIIASAVPENVRYALTNLVACIPRADDGVGKAIEPDPESIKECRPRLEQFVTIAKPKLIVCVGKLAETWLEPGYKHSPSFARATPQVAITHPAAILRANVAMQGLAIRKAVVTIVDAVREHVLKG